MLPCVVAETGDPDRPRPTAGVDDLMFERMRWWTILVPALVVGAIELLSDTLLDEYLGTPWDTLVVFLAVLALSMVYWRLAIGRMRALGIALERQNAELAERNAAARALHRVSVAITALADIDEVLQAVVDQARALLATDVSVLLLVRSDGTPTVRTWSGPPGSVRPGDPDPAEDGTDRSAQMTNQPARGGGADVPDGPAATNDPEVLRFVDRDFAQVHLAAPLQRGGQTIGLLFVGSRRPRGFDVDDVETLASLANQAAIALENARLQGRLRELAVVAERERIAREMHDGLAQVLGYVNTKSQAVETLLADGRVEEARAQLGELAAAARSVYVDVREAILGLRSPIDPEEGLVAAIEEYAARFAEASKLAAVVDATLAARALELPPDVEVQVFRIVQEALTNVRKHAAAHRVRISLSVERDELQVALADDGRGLDGAGQGAGDWPHYGVDAIRERAAAIGGTVRWESGAGPDAGTTVRLSVPLPEAAARPAVKGAA